MAMAMATAPATLMEKAPVEEWTEEEEASGEVEGDFGLDTKRRKRAGLRNDAPETAVDDAVGEDASTEEDSRSVSEEEDQGAKSFDSDGTALKSTETEFFAARKKLENGNSAFTDIWDDLQSVPKGKEKQDCNHFKVGNGLNLHIDSVDNVEDEVVAAAELETQSQGHNEVTKTLELDVSELDLEKVLEEQETHDLFCPNCHSCITKRVILRKRKRRVQDFQYEERPEKLHVRPNIVATSTEIVETSHDNEPDVFRCLSCFSFFIPTENGFNIFRIFRKREERVNVQVPNIQSSGQASTGDGNWLSSIFKPELGRNKGNEAAQLQPQLDVSFGGDHDLEKGRDITSLPKPPPVEVEESYASDGKLHSAVQYPVVLDVLSGGDQLQNENNTDETRLVSESANAGENHSTILKITSDDDDIIPVIIKKPSRSGGIDQSNNDAFEIIPPTTVSLTHDDDDIIPVIIKKPARSGGIDQSNNDAFEIMPPTTVFLTHDDDMIKPILVVEPSSSQGTSQKDLSISISAAQPTVFLPLGGEVQINVSNPMLVEPRRENEWEVLKSIVYGGLIESITSLGVISSAAGAKTSTLNVVALGLANLVGGFFVMLHDLSELKSSAPANQHDEQTGRYWKLLGRKSNFGLHATVAIISYIFFGLLPPIIYGFSFRERDLKEEKIIAVASSSLLCIALLSIAKARVSEPRSYIKTFLYYLGLGFSASGISFVAGVLIHRFLDQLGLFEHDHPLPLPPPHSIGLFGTSSGLASLAAQ